MIKRGYAEDIRETKVKHYTKLITALKEWAEKEPFKVDYSAEISYLIKTNPHDRAIIKQCDTNYVRKRTNFKN